MKLHKYYSIDECNNEEALFEKLESLQNDGKIEYQKNDNWSIKVTDLELSTKGEEDLAKFFESIDLYPTDGDEDEDYDFFDDDDEFDEGYKPRKGGYDDNFNDF